ncbi:MAG: redoxin domain-containing protein [Candidatus Eisenbacteria bacterium]|nr:redoxin domain-containing protein [Candidatus Eisenbacteria bacterium]
MRRSTLLVAAMLVAVAAFSLPMAGCGTTEETPGTEETSREPATPGTGENDDVTGTAVGQFPPEFELPDLDDNTVTLADYEGDVVIIDLWATWCPPCREEIPFLIELYEEHRNDGLVVIGIGLDQGGADVLRPFAEKHDISYPILVGGREISRTYRASSIPTTYIIGRDGRIAARHVGFHPSMKAEMREMVEGLLKPVEA